MQAECNKLSHGRCADFSTENNGKRLTEQHEARLYQANKSGNDGTAALNHHSGESACKQP